MNPSLLLAKHDLRLLVRNRRLLGTTALGMGTVLALVLVNLRERPPEEAFGLFFFLFVTAAIAIPIALAINGILGEKERGTMESLLLLPMSEGQFIAGKVGVTLVAGFLGLGIVGVVGAASAIWLGPPGTLAVFLDPLVLYTALVVSPLTVVPFALLALSVSARAPDASTASAMNFLVVLPFWIILFGTWMGVVSVNRILLVASTCVLILLTCIAYRIALWAIRPEAMIQRRR